MIRLYLDEDLASALASALRAHSLDVLTTPEADRRGRPDSEQLAFATEQGRTLCTANQRDFSRLHAEYLSEARSHAGIILIDRHRTTYGAQARAVARLCAALSAEEICDQLIYLSAWLST